MKKSLSSFYNKVAAVALIFMTGPWTPVGVAARDVTSNYERARERSEDCAEELEALEEEFDAIEELWSCTGGSAAAPRCTPRSAEFRTGTNCGLNDCGSEDARSGCKAEFASTGDNVSPIVGLALLENTQRQVSNRDILSTTARRNVRSACFQIYVHLNGDLSRLKTQTCRTAVQSCDLVILADSAQIEQVRFYEVKAAVTAKERECRRLEARAGTALSACADCQAAAAIEAMRPSRGELIAGGVVGGLSAIMGGAVGISGFRQQGRMYEGYLNQYGGYLDQCAQMAVPCQGPMGPGGGGYGYGLGAGMNGLGGLLGGLGGLGGMGGGIGFQVGGYPGMGGGGCGMMGCGGGMWGPGMGGGGGIGFQVGGGLGMGGYPGMGGGGCGLMGCGGGLGLGGLGGGLGMGLGYPNMGGGGLGGCLGCGGMMGPGMGMDYSMLAQQQQMQMQMQQQMQQQQMQMQQARMQAQQQYSQDIMVAQQQMMQAQARYASGAYGGFSAGGSGSFNFNGGVGGVGGGGGVAF